MDLNKGLMKNAIITFGVGYKFDDIKYFIHSCYANAPEVDLYIFVGKNIRSLRKASIAYPRVHFIRYRESIMGRVIAKGFQIVPSVACAYARLLRRIYPKAGQYTSVVNSLAIPLTQFMVKRFFIIQTLMKRLPQDQFMLTDIRDVLVQSDPFVNISEKSIVTGVEPLAIGDCAFNSKWINQTYSPQELDEMKAWQIACAGVTIGSRKAIEQYVKEMIVEIYNNLDKIIGRLGADQAIHAKLFYLKLDGLRKKMEHNGDGCIATLHFSKLNEFLLTDGQLLNADNTSVAVVHQYDRHADLAVYLKHHLDKGIEGLKMAS